MADKKINEVSTLTDFDYALVVKGNDVAKVSKQQLASIVGGLLGGTGGTFVDRGTFTNSDNLTKNGSSKTDVNYQGVYSFAASRTILQFKLNENGVLMARKNNDYLYHKWGEWKTIINL